MSPISHLVNTCLTLIQAFLRISQAANFVFETIKKSKNKKITDPEQKRRTILRALTALTTLFDHFYWLQYKTRKSGLRDHFCFNASRAGTQCCTIRMEFPEPSKTTFAQHRFILNRKNNTVRQPSQMKQTGFKTDKPMLGQWKWFPFDYLKTFINARQPK